MKELKGFNNLGVAERIRLRLIEKSHVLNCTEIDYVKLNDALEIVIEEIKPKQEEYSPNDFCVELDCPAKTDTIACALSVCSYNDFLEYLEENNYKIIKEE